MVVDREGVRVHAWADRRFWQGTPLPGSKVVEGALTVKAPDLPALSPRAGDRDRTGDVQLGKIAVAKRRRSRSVPPPRIFVPSFLRHPAQIRRSWYMGYFQLPGAAARLAADDFAFVDRLWRDWSPGWDFPAERLAGVKATLGDEEGASHAIGYYPQRARPAVDRPFLFRMPGPRRLRPRDTDGAELRLTIGISRR
jgi:hypothetical protein